MGRRVSVTVEADFSDVVDGAAETAVAAKVAKKELEALGREADRTGRDMDELAAETALAKKELQSLDRTVVIIPGHARNMEKSADGAARGVSKVGEEAKQTEADLKLLDRRIATLQRSLRNLNISFAAAGGDSGIAKRIAQQDKLLKQLGELRKKVAGGDGKSGVSLDSLLPDASTIARAGMKAGKGFGATFAAALENVPWKGVLIGGAVGAVALALPVLGGMIAGAVAGSIGTIGIAGGILAASKDPVVKSAAEDFGHHISTSFFGSGSAFIDPIRESLGILQKDFDKLDIEKSFAKVAPLTTTIASGLGGLATKTMPGLNKALDRMEPFAKAAAVGFGEIGNALGGLADDATKSHGALEGLELLFSVASGTIAATGKIILWLSDRLQGMNETIEFLARKMLAFSDALHIPDAGLRHFVDDLGAFNKYGARYAKDGAELAGDAFAKQAEQEQKARDELKSLQDTIDGYINNATGLADANIAVAQKFADLHKELIKGKKNWDLNTQAGRDNNQNIKEGIQTLEHQRQQAIATGDGSVTAVDKANKAFNDQMAVLEALAVKAGDTKKAFEDMAGVYHITIVADFVAHNAAVLSNKTDKNLKLHGFASGGDPDPGLAWVGEHGKELVDFGSGAHVFNHQQSMSMSRPWGGSASGGGGGTMRHVLDLQLNGRTIRTLLLTDGTSRGVSKVDLAEAYP